ncbi:MAG: hypothetical protein EBR02_01555 [Alphaproteobacteria bacterium]|nr:hypothetical protein [Alphaproteobacteria bacterium]
MTLISINGKLVDEAEATVSVLDRGFRFGDGVFETISVYNGVPYQFEYHMARMLDGLAAIKINFDYSMLRTNVKELLAANDMQNGMLRIQVTRGIGSRGYLPDDSHPLAGATCVIETMERPPQPEDGVKLWLSNFQKPPALYLPTQFKLCQGLSSTLARMDAVENGCFDAVMLGEGSFVCETSSANIFWMKDGQLNTPALGFGALAGSTRAAILRTYPTKIQEVVVTISDLASAQAVILTNSAWQVLAVGGLEPKGISFNSGELALQLRVLLAKDIAAYCRDHKADWQ